jgi:hypothetical protein
MRQCDSLEKIIRLKSTSKAIRKAQIKGYNGEHSEWVEVWPFDVNVRLFKKSEPFQPTRDLIFSQFRESEVEQSGCG